MSSVDKPTTYMRLTESDGLRLVLPAGRQTLLLDLTDVPALSSVVVGQLIQHRDEVVLINPRPPVKETLRLLGVEQLFPVVQTLEEARTLIAGSRDLISASRQALQRRIHMPKRAAQ